MRQITDIAEYQALHLRLSGILGRTPAAISLPVSIENSSIAYAPFDAFFREPLYLLLMDLCRQRGGMRFVLMVERPDPIKYYYRHFGLLHSVEFDLSDNFRTYIDAANFDPGGSPADSIIDHADLIFLMFDCRNWLVVADRDSNLCAFIASGDSLANNMLEQHSDVFFSSEEEAIRFSRRYVNDQN